LHAQDIVHCDIKCRNVLVGSIGDVKLADFGGARRLDGSSAIMLESDVLKVKGTPLWMAPEVARQVEQGPASDIWSLGCTVVEMATGKAPWSEFIAGISNPFVALYHIGCSEEVPDLPSCLSEQGQDFLRKCFQRDPTARWTAAQLLQHPFIMENFSAMQSSKPSEDLFNQASPTSAFDFPSSSATTLTTSIVNSVPILRSPLSTMHRQQQQVVTNFFQTNQEKPTTSSSASGTDFWCNSPLSDMSCQWIDVHTPKTSTSSPTSPSASHESFKVPAVEEDEATISTAQECNLEVEEEILEIPTCSLNDMEADEERESLDITTEQASCSTVNEEDGLIFGLAPIEESSECATRAGCHSSSNIRRERRRIFRRHQDSDDFRSIDPQRRLKPKCASSLRASIRILASAHRKLSLRLRSEPRQRLRVRRKLQESLQESLHRKYVMLKRSLYSFVFRQGLCPHDRNPENFVASLLNANKVQPSFFRNRLFLNTS
jgi:hypothetical protein